MPTPRASAIIRQSQSRFWAMHCHGLMLTHHRVSLSEGQPRRPLPHSYLPPLLSYKMTTLADLDLPAILAFTIDLARAVSLEVA